MAESTQEKNGDFELHAQQILINLSWNKQMVVSLTELHDSKTCYGYIDG